MKKKVIYKYLGTNGVIESTVHLEDIYYVCLYALKAAPGMILTNGERKVYSVRIPAEELSNWTEVIDDQAK